MCPYVVGLKLSELLVAVSSTGLGALDASQTLMRRYSVGPDRAPAMTMNGAPENPSATMLALPDRAAITLTDSHGKARLSTVNLGVQRAFRSGNLNESRADESVEAKRKPSHPPILGGSTAPHGGVYASN